MSESHIQMTPGDTTIASTENTDISVKVESFWDNQAEETRLRVTFTGYGTEWGKVIYDGWKVEGLMKPGIELLKITRNL